MSLSADQVFLLNTLTYISNDNIYGAKAGNSVGSFVQGIINDPGLAQSLSGGFQSADQILDACRRIADDPALSSMQIAHVSSTTGGANRMIFVTPDSAGVKQAVVSFQGTTGGVEWRDNFLGGMTTDAKDSVSTPEQEATLDWFQNDPDVQRVLEGCDKISVSGHSKGGNRAKYLTLFDERIDECISFDGQGFSDEFLKVYGDKISEHQGKIHNYNHQADYVSNLLNDIGITDYVEGRDNGEDFLQNHSPFALLEGIPMDQNTTEQWPPMREMDEIINGFLRTLNLRDKKNFLSLLGEATADLMGEDEKFDGSDVLDYLYRICCNDVLSLIKRFLEYMAAYASYEYLELLMNWMKKEFPYLKSLIDDVFKQTQKQLGVVDGKDIRIAVRAAGRDLIVADTAMIKSLSAQLRILSESLDYHRTQIEECAALCDEYHIRFRMTASVRLAMAPGGSTMVSGAPIYALEMIGKKTQTLSIALNRCAAAITRAADRFEECEKQVIAGLPVCPDAPAPF